MIFHPSIIALFVSSLLTGFVLLYACYYGIQILRKWDIQSGSEGQLALERKTYLISTILNYAFGFQLLSLFLYLFIADRLHTYLVGAMCAAGSLYANACGYPVLVFKVANVLLVGVWLILNYVDNRAYDYPLIKKKNILLLVLAPSILVEAFLQTGYFVHLKPNLITSCCGSLFSADNRTVLPALFPNLSIQHMKAVYFLSLTLTGASGLRFYLKDRGAYLFSLSSVLTMAVSLLSIYSFISVYFYELPTHHCPFCLLQKEYGYAGFPLYLTLFAGSILGMGPGILEPFRRIESLRDALPFIRKKLALLSLVLLAIFVLIVACRMTFTDFVLEG
jgi:hypothetical protein